MQANSMIILVSTCFYLIISVGLFMTYDYIYELIFLIPYAAVLLVKRLLFLPDHLHELIPRNQELMSAALTPDAKIRTGTKDPKVI